MDKATLDAERIRVAARASSLERELASLAEQQALTSHDDEHDPEGVTIAVQRAQMQGLLDGARAELAELGRAADRLADGTYGRCRLCGGDIAPERLEALPAATTCIGCANRNPRRPRFR